MMLPNEESDLFQRRFPSRLTRRVKIIGHGINRKSLLRNAQNAAVRLCSDQKFRFERCCEGEWSVFGKVIVLYHHDTFRRVKDGHGCRCDIVGSIFILPPRCDPYAPLFWMNDCPRRAPPFLYRTWCDQKLKYLFCRCGKNDLARMPPRCHIFTLFGAVNTASSTFPVFFVAAGSKINTCASSSASVRCSVP